MVGPRLVETPSVGRGAGAQRQLDVESAAGKALFVAARTLDPEATAVGLDNAASDGQPEAGTASFESRFARRV